MQVNTLLSIKTGPARKIANTAPKVLYHTVLEAERLMEVEKVLERAREAKANGSSRFCMGGCLAQLQREGHALHHPDD